MASSTLIKIKQILSSLSMPVLAFRELAIAKDTDTVYIGSNSSGNLTITTNIRLNAGVIQLYDVTTKTWSDYSPPAAFDFNNDNNFKGCYRSFIVNSNTTQTETIRKSSGNTLVASRVTEKLTTTTGRETTTEYAADGVTVKSVLVNNINYAPGGGETIRQTLT